MIIAQKLPEEVKSRPKVIIINTSYNCNYNIDFLLVVVQQFNMGRKAKDPI